MYFIHDETSAAGQGERKLYTAICHNVANGFSLHLTQTLHLLLDALQALRGQSKRSLADDLRREGVTQLASEIERIGQLGPWIDGYRWRVTKHYIVRGDADWSPDDKSERNVSADDVRPLLQLPFNCIPTRRIPDEIEANLVAKGLKPRQADDAPWIGWFAPDETLAAIVAPIVEDAS